MQPQNVCKATRALTVYYFTIVITLEKILREQWVDFMEWRQKSLQFLSA